MTHDEKVNKIRSLWNTTVVERTNTWDEFYEDVLRLIKKEVEDQLLYAEGLREETYKPIYKAGDTIKGNHNGIEVSCCVIGVKGDHYKVCIIGVSEEHEVYKVGVIGAAPCKDTDLYSYAYDETFNVKLQ